ncbi:MAG: hypothetical protein U9O20_01600 [Patescibacteria group bacterium]|nr:hypothetical protein [Patescibacteria group bacterium]
MENLNYFQNWSDTFVASTQKLWLQAVAFIPELISALIVLVIGLLIAAVFGRIARKIFTYTKIDYLMEKMKIKQELEKIGLKFQFTNLAGSIVKWFFIIAVWIAVFDILNVPQITDFLKTIALYIPNVLVAVIVLAIGLILGNFVSKIVNDGLDAAKIQKDTASLLASISKWAIIIFSLMAALTQLGIASDLIKILFTGFVAAISLASGLAFGLGGKNKATEWLEKINRKSQ